MEDRVVKAPASLDPDKMYNFQGHWMKDLPLEEKIAKCIPFLTAAKLVSEEAVASSVVCGPDRDKHIEEIKSFSNAGFDHVYIHQVGPDQEGFFRFYEREILPKLH